MSAHDDVTVATIASYPAEAAVEIVEGTIYLRKPGGFEPADLDLLPDDRRRHELLDGVLVVSPAPNWPHQRAVSRLNRLLGNIAPEGYDALVAPFDISAGPRSVVEPDVLVLPSTDMTAPAPLPSLVVEVLSPSNRGYDRITKRNLYQNAGVPSYWIIDPDEPSITILELRQGQYVEVAHATGDEKIRVTNPYEITLVPSELVR